MRKQILLALLLMASSLNLRAQYHFTATVNTSSTNQFIQIPSFFLESILNVAIGTVTGDKILFEPQLTFPVSIRNSSDLHYGKMKGGYARAFSAPWKYVGDYKIGISGAWDHYENPFGFYTGISYKSNEVVYEGTDLNDRAHYVAPEAGLRFKFGEKRGVYVEAGASYDYAFKYKSGNRDYDEKAVNSGASLNLGFGGWNHQGHFQLNANIPLYNFYNKDFTPDNGKSHPFENIDRSIGYISFKYRYYIEY